MDIQPNQFNLEECIYEYKRLRLHFDDPETHPPGNIRVLDWDLDYVYGPSIAAFLEYQVIRGVNDFNADNDSPLILDCGANIGFSSLAYKKRYPNAKVIAFEPDPEFLPILKKNIDQNNITNIEIVDKAVWYSNGVANWYCQGIDGSKLVAKDEQGKKTASVETVDLSEYLTSPVDLVKLDVEGSEFEIISHLRGKLGNVKNMSIECHLHQATINQFCELLETLHEEGFDLGINTLNWRDLINQPEIPTEHFSQYIVVSAWRTTQNPISVFDLRLPPFLPVEYELIKREYIDKNSLLHSLEKLLNDKVQSLEQQEIAFQKRELDFDIKEKNRMEEFVRKEIELGSKEKNITEEIERKEMELNSLHQSLSLNLEEINIRITEFEREKREFTQKIIDLNTREESVQMREHRYENLALIKIYRFVKRSLQAIST